MMNTRNVVLAFVVATAVLAGASKIVMGPGQPKKAIQPAEVAFGVPPEASQSLRADLQDFREKTRVAGGHLKAATGLLRQGDLVGAEQEAELAVREGPRLKDGEHFGPFLKKLGDVYLAQQRYAKALTAYTRAKKSTGGEELEACILICKCKLGQITLEQGTAAADRIRGYTPKKLAAAVGGPTNARTAEAYVLWLRALQLHFRCVDEEAIPWFDKAQEILPHQPLLALKHGDSARFLKRYGEAVAQYKIATAYGDPEIRKRADRRRYGAQYQLEHAD